MIESTIRSGGIPHQDILAVYGNPYIGVVTKWGELLYQRKKNLKQQYPEIDQVADCLKEIKQAMDDMMWNCINHPLDTMRTDPLLAIAALAMIPPQTRGLGQAYITYRASVAVAPKLESVIRTVISPDKARQFSILLKKKAGNGANKEDSAAHKERLKLEFGKGKYWDSLTNRKQSQHLDAICRRTKPEVRMDEDGFYYKFDKAHMNQKVHLHKYRHKGGEKYQMIAEVNPETGEVTPKIGKVEIW